MKSFILLLASTIALLGMGCQDGGRENPPAEVTRGYVLISLDTLRADRLGCYGYERETSPFIDSFAARSVLFENAYVQEPGTLPSHMSIFTGLYPAEHNVRPPTGVLSPEIKTLPEAFQAAGYRTAGFTEGGYVHGGYGFARGFDEFSHETKKVESDVERTLERGLRFLDSLAEQDKFFLFMHSYVVHDPYFPPEPYDSLFWEGDPPAGVVKATGPNLQSLNKDTSQVSPIALTYYEALYDAQIRYVDDVLKKFFDDLESRGLMEDITIVLTSDHGEEFLEHGRFLHAQIYRETLHVPLIVYRPNATPKRVSQIVESVDIAPTLYDLSNIEFEDPMSGISMRALIEGGESGRWREAYSHNFDTTRESLILRDRDGVYQVISKNMGTTWPRWFSKQVSFETFEENLEVSILSFHRPRTLEIFVDGEKLGEKQLKTEWHSVELDLADSPGRHRVELRTEGCDVPAELGINEDRRCLSFMLDKPLFEGFEIYNMDQDPRGEKDLSTDLADRATDMTRGFENYRLKPRVEGMQKVLDPELEARLKALGYLQ